MSVTGYDILLGLCVAAMLAPEHPWRAGIALGWAAHALLGSLKGKGCTLPGCEACAANGVSPKAASVPPPAPLSVSDREAIARSAGVLRALAGAWRRQAATAATVEQSPLLRQALRAERLAVDSDELLASLGAERRWAPDGPGDFPAVERCPVCSARYPHTAQPEQTPQQRRQAGGQASPSGLGRQPEAGSSHEP